MSDLDHKRGFKNFIWRRKFYNFYFTLLILTVLFYAVLFFISNDFENKVTRFYEARDYSRQSKTYDEVEKTHNKYSFILDNIPKSKTQYEQAKSLMKHRIAK